MSPEQVAGQRDLDARSDVYPLACVTYEMLAGDPPFIASNPQAVMAKHVTDPAAPITTTRPSVSPAIAHALTKALNKTPVDTGTRVLARLPGALRTSRKPTTLQPHPSWCSLLRISVRIPTTNTSATA